ncbi:MAG TPA: FHA domain-containing protein [Bryobacteraceae bacterium]|nr:FHA domain-containing protein [Bryobacteraceae bacterium]
MKRLSFFAAVAICLNAQSATQRMLDMSVEVYGAIQDGDKIKGVTLAGGFIVDAKHVVTNGEYCCGKTDSGQQKMPFVHVGDKDIKAKAVWSGDGDMVILELEQELPSNGITLAPSKLDQKGEPIYTVQFPDKGDPTVSETKLQEIVKVEKVSIPVIKASATSESVERGSALFDGCGNVIGVNALVSKGSQLAFVIDPLSAGLQKVGIQARVATGACTGAAESGGGDGKSGGQAPPPDDNGLHLPKGKEWIGFAVLASLAFLAFRKDTRQQVVRALTTRRMPVNRPPAPAYQPPVPIATKPAMRGLTGQYAGTSIPVELRPTILGRDQSVANLVFGAGSDSVSKRHCAIRWDAARGTFVLEDLGSTNGTFLATGERLTPGQPRELRPGDRFYVGDTRNQFEFRME